MAGEVRAVSLQIEYDRVTAADHQRVGSAPTCAASATVVLDNSADGLVVVTFSSAVALPAGPNTLVNLEASVPTVNANETYLSKQVVTIHSATVTDANANSLPVIENSAVHAVHYFGDVSGNRRINASDAALVARVAALLDGGFGADPLTNPVIVGDISSNGRLNAGDASLVARAAALLDVPQIPVIPSGVTAGGCKRCRGHSVGQP